jgi:hypothetical protein
MSRLFLRNELCYFLAETAWNNGTTKTDIKLSLFQEQQRSYLPKPDPDEIHFTQPVNVSNIVDSISRHAASACLLNGHDFAELNSAIQRITTCLAAWSPGAKRKLLCHS